MRSERNRNTTRFSAVVSSCGEPEILYPWTLPELKPEFLRAAREERVMTLTQEAAGQHIDYGVAGLFEDQNAAYLVFPKPLSAFRHRKIVGIKYELIKHRAPAGTAASRMRESTGRFARVEPARVEPVPEQQHGARGKPAKRFRLTIRLTATTEVIEEVDADSRQQAIEKASHAVGPSDFSRARVSRKVTKVNRL